MYNRLNKSTLNPGAGLAVLIGGYLFFLCLLSFASEWLLPRFENMQKDLRIIYIFQAVFVFIIPALMASVVTTRLPARLLCIERRPAPIPVLLTVMVMLVSIPAMNLIIKWNAGISLPESMHGLEEWMRNLESSAEDTINILIGSHTVGNLIMSVLIIGVLAGFSEELFFRGAMQRILSETRLGAHGAIWLTAIIFSALHMQFFGFFPRLILGLLFGYILYWSKSLWMPIVAHIFNNSLACIVSWCQNKTISEAEVVPEGPDIAYALSSALITVFALVVLYRKLRRSNKMKNETENSEKIV